MACKIKVVTNKTEDNDGVWNYVIDTKYSISKPIHKLFLDEKEAEEYANKILKLKKEKYVIEEVE